MRMRAYERALWKSTFNEDWFVSFFKYLKPPAPPVAPGNAPNGVNIAARPPPREAANANAAAGGEPARGGAEAAPEEEEKINFFDYRSEMDEKLVGLASDEERQSDLLEYLKHAPYFTHEKKLDMLRQGGK